MRQLETIKYNKPLEKKVIMSEMFKTVLLCALLSSLVAISFGKKLRIISKLVEGQRAGLFKLGRDFSVPEGRALGGLSLKI